MMDWSKEMGEQQEEAYKASAIRKQKEEAEWKDAGSPTFQTKMSDEKFEDFCSKLNQNKPHVSTGTMSDTLTGKTVVRVSMKLAGNYYGFYISKRGDDVFIEDCQDVRSVIPIQALYNILNG